MQIGKRVLVLVLGIGLNACGGLATSATEDSPSSVTSETSTPAAAGDTIATTTSGGDSSSTTLVNKSTTTTESAEPPVSTSLGTSDQGTSGNYDPALQPYVDQAIADLAGRLGEDPSSITVISAEAVVWPDGSLGCPEPGMIYTQAQVDGLLIRLSADGIEYRYHSGGRITTPFLCENPK